MSQCCICNKKIERDDPAVLAMGGAGIPRYLCDDCEKLLDDATLSTDYDTAGAAIGKLSKLMADGDPDPVTYAIVNGILIKSSNRAVAIKEGTYDFALDDEPIVEEGYDEVPEDLQETEEDKEKDRIDEEKQKKFDKIYNILLIIGCSVFAVLCIWRLIEMFLIK